MDATITLTCTTYGYNLLASKLFYLRFKYDDEQGKILRDLNARAVARYTFKGNNTLMITTITFNLKTSDLKISCIGNADPHYSSTNWNNLFLSLVNDHESKLY